MDILKALNEYTGFITLLVGSVAIWTYNKQKQDTKRKSAKLILQEIRYAEQTIRNAKTQANGNYSLSDKLLPTNSWHQNIHLFVKVLKESQIDLISRFYSQAQYLDVLIRQISEEKCSQNKEIKEIPIIKIQQIPNQQIQPQQETGAFVQNQPPILPQPHIFPLQIPPESMTKIILKEVTSNMELIYNTPAVDKLIKISEKKWYQLF